MNAAPQRPSAAAPARRATLRLRTSLIALGSVFAIGMSLGACVGASDPPSTTFDEALVAALAACHMDDGTVDHTAEIRACTPAEETHKTTICHIPPGNPANAHTLCIGNQAVPAHLDNHGDYLGPCKTEQPCPPPGGTDGTGGTHGGATGGTPGTDHATGGSSGTGSGGAPAAGTGGMYLIG